MAQSILGEIPAQTAAVADRFMAAVQAGELDSIRRDIYAPDAVIWHNTDDLEVGPEENLRRLAWLGGVVADLRYEDIRRLATVDGYVQQHTVRGTAPDGGRLELRACFIVHVADSKIVRLDEYLDSAGSACLDPFRPERC